MTNYSKWDKFAAGWLESWSILWLRVSGSTTSIPKDSSQWGLTGPNWFQVLNPYRDLKAFAGQSSRTLKWTTKTEQHVDSQPKTTNSEHFPAFSVGFSAFAKQSGPAKAFADLASDTEEEEEKELEKYTKKTGADWKNVLLPHFFCTITWKAVEVVQRFCTRVQNFWRSSMVLCLMLKFPVVLKHQCDGPWANYKTIWDIWLICNWYIGVQTSTKIWWWRRRRRRWSRRRIK